MKHSTPAIVLCLVSLASAHAADHVVDQKNKEFSAKQLNIKVGDSVKFQNSDSVAHNLFSLSDAKTFDVGTFTTGQARDVKFDKAGKVEVECAIHPTMKMTVEVDK